MKKVMIISLGGSLIVPNKINYEFLNKLKKVLKKNSRKYKFVMVCGGGQTARTYIQGLENEKINPKKKVYFQSLLGISATRMNARLLTYFFGEDAHQGIPHNMKQIKNLLKRHDIVFCGALRYSKNQTSDSTSAKLAKYFKTQFINLTNVKGLYEKNPKKFRSAKFIPEISHKDFLKKAKEIEFKPGQHFVLDQTAAKVIKKHSITTYIIGEDMKQLDNLLKHKHFIGTRISN
jgi:uridylate kinase